MLPRLKRPFTPIDTRHLLMWLLKTLKPCGWLEQSMREELRLKFLEERAQLDLMLEKSRP